MAKRDKLIDAIAQNHGWDGQGSKGAFAQTTYDSFCEQWLRSEFETIVKQEALGAADTDLQAT